MLNTCVLVGFIKEVPVIKKENGQDKYYLKVETDRPYRNAQGVIEKDVFNVRIWHGIADEMINVCQPGTLVAIKGRMIADEKTNNCGIIAEQMSFPGRIRTKNLGI